MPAQLCQLSSVSGQEGIVYLPLGFTGLGNTVTGLAMLAGRWRKYRGSVR
ncbi:hypothetical protein [Amycolatopsis antarctica]|nr:hypothetical protein [Amycolatopsis antarctica]